MLAKLELPTTILCSFMMPKTKCFSFEEKLHIIKFAEKIQIMVQESRQKYFTGEKLKFKIVYQQKEAILTDWKCNEKKKRFEEFGDVNKAL